MIRKRSNEKEIPTPKLEVRKKTKLTIRYKNLDQLANCQSAPLEFLVLLSGQLSIGCIKPNVELIADFVSDLQLCYLAIKRIILLCICTSAEDLPVNT